MTSVTRRWWLLAIAGAPIALGLSAQTLSVRLDNDFLRVNAPALDFLGGKAFERLKDGNTVGYTGQLTVATGDEKTIQARSAARFAISYDIWEQTFKVTLVNPGKAAAAHLTAAAAQSWCLDALKIDLAHVPANKPIWVRLEIRADDPKDGPNIIGDGISLGALIDIISRPPRTPQQRWIAETEALTLADLRKRGGS
jgi:hypothetical protein